MTVSLRFLPLLLLPVLGCGPKHPFSKDQLDRARGALETSLESWKKGESLERLRSLPEPIAFTEEGPKQGVRLLDFQILSSNHTDSDMIRFVVKLHTQDRRGRKEEREVTYAVALKSPITIGRDPYF